MAENTKLSEYIKASRLSGRTDKEIRNTLSGIGWTDEPLNQAFSQVDSQSYATSSPAPKDTVAKTTNYSPSGYQEEPVSSRTRLFLLLTIVGLLIVFAVAALVVNLHGPSTQSGAAENAATRDQTRETDIKNYATELSKYLKDHNRFPAVSGSGLDSTDGGPAGIFDKSGSLKTYLTDFPTDPKNGQNLCQVNASTPDIHCAYKYRVSADGKSYILWAVLENSYNNEGVYTADTAGHHTLVSAEPKNP